VHEPIRTAVGLLPDRARLPAEREAEAAQPQHHQDEHALGGGGGTQRARMRSGGDDVPVVGVRGARVQVDVGDPPPAGVEEPCRPAGPGHLVDLAEIRTCKRGRIARPCAREHDEPGAGIDDRHLGPPCPQERLAAERPDGNLKLEDHPVPWTGYCRRRDRDDPLARVGGDVRSRLVDRALGQRRRRPEEPPQDLVVCEPTAGRPPGRPRGRHRVPGGVDRFGGAGKPASVAAPERDQRLAGPALHGAVGRPGPGRRHGLPDRAHRRHLEQSPRPGERLRERRDLAGRCRLQACILRAL